MWCGDGVRLDWNGISLEKDPSGKSNKRLEFKRIFFHFPRNRRSSPGEHHRRTI
jgi:hypothetical protein